MTCEQELNYTLKRIKECELTYLSTVLSYQDYVLIKLSEMGYEWVLEKTGVVTIKCR